MLMSFAAHESDFVLFATSCHVLTSPCSACNDDILLVNQADILETHMEQGDVSMDA